MEKKIKSAFLLDLYGALLTVRQRQVMDSYVCEDLTVSEIAEGLGVSRQAASEMIRRTQAILDAYEEKLGLFGRFEKGRELLDELEGQVAGERAHALIQSLREAL
jgi:predicted DNA-binding protein YlxM (UPF0122 family)